MALIEQIPYRGLVAGIAADVYKNAYRQIPATAVVTALALMAGICGRAYSINGKGLNLFMLLLAGSGTGKNSIGESISRLIGLVSKTTPAAVDFIGPASFASPQAAVRHLTKQPCVVSHFGEVGLLLQQLCSPKADANAKGLLRLLLDLFSTSGPDAIIRPTAYSDITKNTTPIIRPAFSFVGDSTPSEFFKAFDERHVLSGLIPRLVIVEYTGDVPKANEGERSTSPDLIGQIAALCAHTLMLNSRNESQPVFLDEGARRQFDFAEGFYLDEVNSKHASEIEKILWSRRNEKAYRIAALLAVGVNPYAPVIDEEQAEWALNFEYENTMRLINAFEAGEVGEQAASESAQQIRLRAVIKDWFSKPWAELQRYKIGTEAMRMIGVIPYSYISKRLTSDAAFKNAKFGATATIKKTIKELFDCGELRRVSPQSAQERFNTTSECYTPSNFEEFMSGINHEVKAFF